MSGLTSKNPPEGRGGTSTSFYLILGPSGDGVSVGVHKIVFVVLGLKPRASCIHSPGSIAKLLVAWHRCFVKLLENSNTSQD